MRRTHIAFAVLTVLAAATTDVKSQQDEIILKRFREMGLPAPDLKAMKQAEQKRSIEVKVFMAMEIANACAGYIVDDRRIMDVLISAGSNNTPTMLMTISQNAKSQAASADDPKPIDCTKAFARFGHPGSEMAGALVPVPSLLAAADAPRGEP